MCAVFVILIFSHLFLLQMNLLANELRCYLKERINSRSAALANWSKNYPQSLNLFLLPCIKKAIKQQKTLILCKLYEVGVHVFLCFLKRNSQIFPANILYFTFLSKLNEHINLIFSFAFFKITFYGDIVSQKGDEFIKFNISSGWLTLRRHAWSSTSDWKELPD